MRISIDRASLLGQTPQRRNEVIVKVQRDPAHDVLVVIPTVADPAVLLQTVARIVADARSERELEGGLRIALSIAINTSNAEHASRSTSQIERICHESSIDLAIWSAPSPVGFGTANNRGTVAALLRWGGLPELVVYHNDDAHVPRGWLRRLLDALRTDVVHGYSEPWDPTSGKRPDRPAAAFGPIGLVGPISNLTAGIQQVRTLRRPNGSDIEWDGNVDGFADSVARFCPRERLTADFLSGFCIGIGYDALHDLFLSRLPDEKGLRPSRHEDSATLWLAPEVPGEFAVCEDPVERLVGPWDEDRYPIAGYEDNDLCVRAELAGWRAIVATDCFVGHIGHQTFDRLFPDQLRGMRNRLRYYRRWATLTDPDRDLRLVATFRIRFEVGHDLHLFRFAIQRAAQLCDAIAVVLTANPLDVRDDVRWPQELKALGPKDVAFLEACSGKGPAEIAELLHAWMVEQVTPVLENRIQRPDQIVVETWTGGFNERDERNRTAELAEGLGADWILSIDGDELVENRIERKHLDRLMRHPDPLVRAYDSSWINHWDTERLSREDPPWGDGGSWTGGMHGFRLWRVPRREDLSLARPRRILAGTEIGLHCGNSPDHEVSAKRVGSFRFRHYGYVRIVDRQRKHARYKDQDPNANPALTGNGGADAYGHILGEQGMRLSPFVALNGIGLAILVHRGEKADDLARVLDQLSTICDRVVLVWTDPWDPGHLEEVLEPAAPEIVAKVAARDETRAARDAWIAANPGQAPPREPARLRAARRVRSAVLSGESWAMASVPEGLKGPSLEVIEVAYRFDCEWVHQPLEDDLAAARNAGLEALSSDSDSLGWSLFWDLDEHFDGFPFSAAVTIRRMAEASDVHAWLFQFLNLHEDAEPSLSESYRLARLLPGMRLHGRVHETYDVALQRYSAAGADPRTRKAPFRLIHLGLQADDAKMDAKLRRYHRLLLLELEDNPHNPAAWVSLALHLLQEGDDAKGLECLERAVLCAGEGYLAYREAAMYHLRRGRVLFLEAMRRSRGSDWFHANEQFANILGQAIPDLPILGSARAGARVIPDLELPPFSPPANPGGLARRR